MEKLTLKGATVIDCTVDKAKTQTEYLQTACNIANNSNVDLFVSIHFNAGGGTGSEVWTYDAHKLKEARAILSNLSALGFKNRGTKNGLGLYVLKHTKMDAILIEVCFVDNKTDYDLYHKIGAEKIAEAIANGIFLNAKKEVNRKMTYSEAITILTKKGIVKTPDYWNNAIKCVKNLDELIINMAEAL